ncbi:hypothetical protein fHeYen301_54 [Yersinia phage fHe-Yen3-01]|uniref:Endolysin n=1 Tax=Yersinia phage fHe-Yen3-01 TaxID=1932893 RepID=A0A1L7DQJ6_9CAUD|nr:endolysin [Yersinia phage fHe-Yen3-01]APU00387.1 hypothetical protein fHeYen301_54 [Yersinia phage fHe-Yen3-01]
MSAIRQSMIYCSVAAVIGIVTTVYPNDLQTSRAGLELIASYENCVSCTYKDSIGKNTIGIGSTRGLDGKPVPNNQLLSNDDIARLLVRDIKESEECVIKYFNGQKMPQPVFDSAVSLVYNNGCYGTRWNKSANRPTFIARYAVAGDWNNVCYRFSDFVNAGGVRSKGLVNRRTAEQKLCIQYRQ